MTWQLKGLIWVRTTPPLQIATDKAAGHPDTTEARICVLRRAISEVGEKDYTKYYRKVGITSSGFMHWCGIFTLSVLRDCRVLTDDWRIGYGYLSYSTKQVRHPAPGDIAYFDNMQHHAIVYSVHQNQLYTIDGNSTGGAVRARVRDYSSATSFWNPWRK